jgi:hypothetical protein
MRVPSTRDPRRNDYSVISERLVKRHGDFAESAARRLPIRDEQTTGKPQDISQGLRKLSMLGGSTHALRDPNSHDCSISPIGRRAGMRISRELVSTEMNRQIVGNHQSRRPSRRILAGTTCDICPRATGRARVTLFARVAALANAGMDESESGIAGHRALRTTPPGPRLQLQMPLADSDRTTPGQRFATTMKRAHVREAVRHLKRSFRQLLELTDRDEPIPPFRSAGSNPGDGQARSHRCRVTQRCGYPAWTGSRSPTVPSGRDQGRTGTKAQAPRTRSPPFYLVGSMAGT